MKQTAEYLALIDSALKEDGCGKIQEDEFTAMDFARDIAEHRKLGKDTARRLLDARVESGELTCRLASSPNGGRVKAYRLVIQ